MSDHVHSPEGADNCFGCKMAYMRAGGGLSVHYPYGGRAAFHGPTIKERADRERALAEEAGYSIRPVNPLYDRPANFKGTA